MHPTRIAPLIALFVIGGLIGWGVVALTDRAGSTAPQVPWTSVGALLVVAVVLLVLANSTYRAIHREGRRMEPRRAVSYLLLAKASALVGAVIAGGYLGFGLQFVDQLSAPLPQQRLIRSLAAAVMGVVIVIAGLLLERACRVPKDKDDQHAPGAPSR